MKTKILPIYLTLLLCCMLLATEGIKAQYPGGVSTGTTRGYKVDYFDGTYSNVSQFGAGGTTKSTPDRSAYSNKITGTEFVPVDADYYGLEYTGTLEIAAAGTYTFSYSGDDQIAVYIDGVLRGSANNTALTFTSSLTAGDHTIKVKYYELGGDNSAALQFTAGPGISAATDIDGRFVRSDNSKLTAWYKATDASVSANFYGAGVDKVNSLTNKAPDYAGNGNMIYSGSGGAGRHSNTQLVNFNQAVNFDGDDEFEGKTLQKGISLRGATKTMFLVNNYTSNVGQSATWMFYHGDNANSQRIGFYKNDAAGNEFAINGGGATNTSAYTANEPKLLGGKLDQVTGVSASATTNPLYMRHNGNAGSTGNFTSDADFEAQGLKFSNMDGAQVPEAIYYPFALSATQEQKVNTYLAVKYGITLAQDYINTSGTTIFSLATNTGYSNRIFGIGRELAAEGLNQKQSQSQMASLAGYNFLVISKGAVAATNAANAGTLADGDYLIVGDNNGALASQTTEIPATFAAAAGCAVNRLTREWKAQVTGNPGAITFQAGSSVYLFPGSASGLSLLVDTDGDGNFTTGTVSTYPVASLVNGVATFNNVTIPNGAVITFAWSVIAPGGVSNGLTLWSKADDAALAAGNVAQWNDLSPNVNNLTRTANANVTKTANLFNYNPAITFAGADNQFLSTTSALGMNGDNTYAEFYVLKGTGASGAAFDEIITLGGTGTDGNAHRWENPSTSLSTDNYFVFGNGTAGSAGAATVTMAQLGLYSNTASGTEAVLRTNGTVAYTNNTTAGLVLDGSPFRIGTDVFSTDGNGNWNSFQSPELIVYNSALSATEINKINTYLSVKYSVPLDGGNSNYISSNGTIIWPTHATYKSDIFGIGRDDCSGLMQKQSTAWVESATNNLRIALGSLAADNQSNTGSFTANNQFLIVGHNGLGLTAVNTGIPAAYTAVSCNANRYQRTWKAANTGSVAGVQLVFGSSTSPVPGNWSNIQLAIDADGNGNFADGAITLVPPATVNGGAATFNNVTIPDGATFTLVFTIGYPGGISAPSSTTAIGGVNHVNGLSYKAYTLATPIVAGGSIATGFGAYNPTQVSAGYLANATAIQNIFSAKLTTNSGVELTGKLSVATASANYRFQASGVDDRFALIIDGITVINATAAGTATSAAVNLSSGYHDIIIRGGNIGGGYTYDLTWNGGSGGTYTAIPDASFYTTVQGPSAWFDATDNILAANADGTVLTSAANNTWYDQSGNGNHITTAGGTNPLYYNQTKTQIRNYNPVIEFTDDRMVQASYLNGFSFGKQGKSVFAVSDIFASGAEETLTGYGTDAITDLDFVLLKNASDQLTLRGWGSPINGFTYGATRRTDILSGTYANGNITTSNNASLYANGFAYTGTRTSWDTRMNDNSQLEVGNAPDRANGLGWDGRFSEVIYYPWALSATERQKLNSYLGIKWGITVDQASSTDYLASDNTVIWNSTNAGAFKYDITGIGRDDCGALNQKQSTSTDGDDIISIGRGTVNATNAANTNAFTNDKNFLLFAHNNASISGTNTTSMPASLTGCYVKINREWQVQTVGTPGTVNIEVGKQGLFAINASNYKPVLLISGTAGNYTGATVIMNDSVRRGKAYFSNVNFSNGQYFTLAYINAAPGGVTSGMKVWLNADYDMFTDAAQTTYAVNDGDAIASINNLKAGATLSKVEQVNAAYNPVYKKGTFNYNAGLLFDGVNDVLATSGNVNTTDYRSATQMTSIMTIFDNTATGNAYWYHDDGTGNSKTVLGKTLSFWNSTSGNVPSITRPQLAAPEIYTYINTNGTTNAARLYSNLKAIGTPITTASAGTVNSRFRIGSNDLAGAGTPTNFYMGELVTYDADKGATTTTEMRQIHSYLATKYGFTLDSTAVNKAYLASNGTTPTYNYTSFWNRITGIGRDDCSAFEQKQSFSQETTGALVKISNDPVNGLAATNDANTATFANNFSFLLFGDNNKSLTWTGVDKVPGNLVRLNRVWRVKETGTVSTVYLQVPASSSAATYKLPAADISTVYLLVSATGNFVAPDQVIEMTPNGTDLSVTYDFADGDYYTFASKKSCIAPAGISDGLTSWYKTDNKGTGGLASFADETGSHTLAKSVAGTATINVGTTASNYSRTLTLASGGYFEKTGLSESSVVAANGGTFFAVGNNKTSLFGLSRANYVAAGVVGPNAIFANTTSASATFNSSYETAGVQNVWINWQAPSLSTGRLGATVNGYTNYWNGGALNITANNTYGLRIGAAYVNAGGTASASLLAGNNTFTEGFTYNRELTNAELLNLNTYLAIKNGQTLSHNYYSPAYDGNNGTSTTIYDVGTYGNRVFGVGIDSAGCFFQKQSNSIRPGSMLKMSIDIINGLAPDNIQNMATFANDRTYVVTGDDNGNVTAWDAATEVPAYYTSSGSCVAPQRILREWKIKAQNYDQVVRITVPGSASAATTKLPALPVGHSKLFMIVNDNGDFTINANQQEIEMTLNGTTNEWEVNFPVTASGSTYKYFTFATKADATAPAPKLVATTHSVPATVYCLDGDRAYYKGQAASGYENDAVLAIGANGNTFAFGAATVTVNNQVQSGPTLVTGNGYNDYYQANSGTYTTRISKMLRTVQASGTYSVNGGVLVRVYYDPTELTKMVGDPVPAGSNPIAMQGWFKSTKHSAADVVSDLTALRLNNAAHIDPVATGTENGINYAEFLVESFSTIGFYAYTLPVPLPVKLSYFTAKANNCAIGLQWKSRTEQNFDRYEVERSTDGVVYSKIYTVIGKNASGADYSYEDNAVIPGVTYKYRLKMIDNDAKFEYSTGASAKAECGVNGNVQLFPNPVVTGTCKIKLSGYTIGANMRIIDQSGKVISQRKVTNGVTEINAATLAHGVYVVQVQDLATQEITTQKLVISRQ